MSATLEVEEEIVLLVARTSADREAAAGRIASLAARASWPALHDELARQRLLPLLGARIVECAPAAVPEAFRKAIERETATARAHSELAELVTLQVAAALDAQGVPAVPLKGPLLARRLHGDAAMRASRDIDLLVAQGDLGRGVGALAQLGWRPDPRAAPPILHARLVSDGALPDVELHWRMHWYESEFGRAALTRAEPSVDGVRRMQAEDELAAVLLFYARDGFAGLRHAIDAAAWWDGKGVGHGTPTLAGVAAAHPPLVRALTASAVVLHDVVGLPPGALVPPQARLPWPERRAAALANPLMRGSPAQILAEVSLVDALLAPAGRRRSAVRRRALPSERQLPQRSGDRSLASRRAGHLARLGARCAYALARPTRVPRLTTRSG